MASNNRRRFIRQLSVLPLMAGLRPFRDVLPATGGHAGAAAGRKPFFRISLAEWSFNQELFAGKMTNMEFPERSIKEFGIDTVEYVNQFFMDKARDKKYLAELKKRCDDLGVRSLRIMCDGEGDMGETNEAKRKQAVENHYKWVEAAQFLGCSDIRVNARGNDTPEAVADAAVRSLSELTAFGTDHGVEVIVENHGGYSSDGRWIAAVMKRVNNPHCGLLPDWGNFCLREGKGPDGKETCLQEYDRYKGTEEMMPFAKGVSAKSYAFDAEGNETTIDFGRMLDITRRAGFKGYMGIEFEGGGPTITEEEGVRKTLALLKKLG